MPETDTFFISEEIALWPATSEVVEVVVHRIEIHTIEFSEEFGIVVEESLAV